MCVGGGMVLCCTRVFVCVFFLSFSFSFSNSFSHALWYSIQVIVHVYTWIQCHKEMGQLCNRCTRCISWKFHLLQLSEHACQHLVAWPFACLSNCVSTKNSSVI